MADGGTQGAACAALGAAAGGAPVPSGAAAPAPLHLASPARRWPPLAAVTAQAAAGPSTTVPSASKPMDIVRAVGGAGGRRALPGPPAVSRPAAPILPSPALTSLCAPAPPPPPSPQVFVSAEVAPWSKTGGLGDVVGGLPIALAQRGHRVFSIAPRYDQYSDAWDTTVTINVLGEDGQWARGGAAAACGAGGGGRRVVRCRV